MVHQALSFLAVDKAGKVLIADADKYHGMKSNLQECTGGGYQPLRDSKICKGFDIYLDGTYIPLEDQYPFRALAIAKMVPSSLWWWTVVRKYPWD